jgi:hypothetical protein
VVVPVPLPASWLPDIPAEGFPEVPSVLGELPMFAPLWSDALGLVDGLFVVSDEVPVPVYCDVVPLYDGVPFTSASAMASAGARFRAANAKISFFMMDPFRCDVHPAALQGANHRAARSAQIASEHQYGGAAVGTRSRTRRDERLGLSESRHAGPDVVRAVSPQRRTREVLAEDAAGSRGRAVAIGAFSVVELMAVLSVGRALHREAAQAYRV